ncbi:DUF4062 domain-containing protein [Bacillus thuringiensis]|uniref:DUF4062 domain-containing protein n=1 Tax=Bacillus cereus group TaxID=86661 RepID=UPI000279B192|nr:MULTISPECIES: DUF4062 domain-containing protein [Bacillus cereus group]EJR82871.1 hypothetical protein IK7_02145 [Bacillus cereus VD156]MCU5274388.1 DUF4062 domain-containing protein [Bacillus cereus]PFS27961.1 DUF4062 domain-containing protein [Bacillus thuringiensis]
MQKKLQVFISSTFTDLEEERQAAVQAVLNAGHIPAGMELFKAGDISQKETIEKWIEESDVYMLILGGRYGSIDGETGKSYTHWEYDFAGELGKPRFAVVITEEALKEKSSRYGPNVFERENYVKYKDFKDVVLSKISKFYSDLKDIKLAVLESLKDYEKDENLFGWVSGKELKNTDKLQSDYNKLLSDHVKLQSKISKLEKQKSKSVEIDGVPYEDVKNCLKNKRIFPRNSELIEVFKEKNLSTDAYYYFENFSAFWARGITNLRGREELEIFLYNQVAPFLMQFNLVEKVKITGKTYEQIQTSKMGLKFLRQDTLEKSRMEA